MSFPVVECLRIYPVAGVSRPLFSGNLADLWRPSAAIVSAELRGGIVGYGEAIVFPELTGETRDSILANLGGDSPDGSELLSAVDSFHPDSFPSALESIEALPRHADDGSLMCGARCSVELALLDATMRFFDRGMDEVVTWMGLPGFGKPGCVRNIRYSGVVAAGGVDASMWQLRRLRRRGVRGFKLRIAGAEAGESLASVTDHLRRLLAKGKVALRVDAGGMLTGTEVVERLGELADVPFGAIEQPVKRGDIAGLRLVRERFDAPLIADESIVTIEDAREEIEHGGWDGVSVKIGKCGGLLPALRIAALIRRSGLRVQLGCALGETSILAAAGVRFLEACPGVSWAEGCLGWLREDVVTRPVRFRFGGKTPRLGGPGLGVEVDEASLERICKDPPIELRF